MTLGSLLFLVHVLNTSLPLSCSLLVFIFLITAPSEPTKPFTVPKEKADVLSATLLYKIHAYL